MKKLLLGTVLGIMGVLAYQRYTGHPAAAGDIGTQSFASEEPAPLGGSAEPRFACDGRTHCSQMTSCAEAEYFLRHCPGVEMDGNNDGEPCESQWCGNHR